MIGDQEQHTHSMPSCHPQVNHLKNSGDLSYDPIAEVDPDVNVLLNENGFIRKKITK